MPSRFLRRSGISIVKITGWLDWQADCIVQAGIGLNGEEWEVMKEAWPNAKIIGFEPHPEIVNNAKKKYPGEVYQYALGDKIEKRTLYAKLRHKDGSSLYPHAEKKEDNQYPEFDVMVTTLDYFYDNVTELGKKILLWLDCEGNELNVLKGSAHHFLNCVEMINIELTSNPPGTGWCDPVETHEWLNDHGFLCQWVHTNRSEAGQVDAVYVRPEIFKREHSCCPEQVRMWEKWKERKELMESMSKIVVED